MGPQKYFWLSCEPEGIHARFARDNGSSGLGILVMALMEIYASEKGFIRLDLKTREKMALKALVSLTEWNDVMREAAEAGILDLEKFREGVMELPERTPHVLRLK